MHMSSGVIPAGKIEGKSRRRRRKVLRSTSRLVAAVLTSTLTFGWAITSAVADTSAAVVGQQQDGAASMAKKLSDPQWVDDLRARLHGNVTLYLPSTPWIQARSDFVVLLVHRMATACGLKLNETTSAAKEPAGHLVFVLSVEPTEPLANAVATLYEQSPSPILTPRQALLDSASSALQKNGIYLGTISFKGRQDGMVSIFDQSKLGAVNHTAVLDFAVLAALVGTRTADTQVNGGIFSYLIGGTSLSDMAGIGDGHFARLCVASAVLHVACDNPSGITSNSAKIKNGVSEIEKACTPGSAAFEGIKNSSDVLDKYKNSGKN